MHPFYYLVKKRPVWDRGSGQQAAVEKTKYQGSRLKAPRISQAGLPFEFDGSVTPGSMGRTLWQEQQEKRVLLGFWSQFWKGAEAK